MGKEKIVYHDMLFAKTVLVEELPPHFCLVQIGEYNRPLDLKEHLGRFEIAALLH